MPETNTTSPVIFYVVAFFVRIKNNAHVLKTFFPRRFCYSSKSMSAENYDGTQTSIKTKIKTKCDIGNSHERPLKS